MTCSRSPALAVLLAALFATGCLGLVEDGEVSREWLTFDRGYDAAPPPGVDPVAWQNCGVGALISGIDPETCSFPGEQEACEAEFCVDVRTYHAVCYSSAIHSEESDSHTAVRLRRWGRRDTRLTFEVDPSSPPQVVEPNIIGGGADADGWMAIENRPPPNSLGYSPTTGMDGVRDGDQTTEEVTTVRATEPQRCAPWEAAQVMPDDPGGDEASSRWFPYEQRAGNVFTWWGQGDRPPVEVNFALSNPYHRLAPGMAFVNDPRLSGASPKERELYFTHMQGEAYPCPEDVSELSAQCLQDIQDFIRSGPFAGGPEECVGDPIDLATGAFVDSHACVGLGGPGPSLTGAVRYDSSVGALGRGSAGLSPGFIASYTRRLRLVFPEPSCVGSSCTVQPAEQVELYTEGGRRVTFPLYGVDRFLPPGQRAQQGWVERRADGWFVLHYQDGSRDVFDARGNLERAVDRFGNGVLVSWALDETSGEVRELLTHTTTGQQIERIYVLTGLVGGSRRWLMRAVRELGGGEGREYAFEYGGSG